MKQKPYQENIEVSRKYRRNISITVGEDDIQAIENLIKGYRKKEEENARIGMLNLVQEDMIKELENNAIPKSKVKEKIEEYEKMKKATYTDLTHYGDLRRDTVLEVSQVLQELMEDK